jgi:GntR family transcriptional regulator
MRTRRLVRDEAGSPIEYVTSLLDPEYFSLHLKF